LRVPLRVGECGDYTQADSWRARSRARRRAWDRACRARESGSATTGHTMVRATWA